MAIIKKEDLIGIETEKASTVFGELDVCTLIKEGIEADVYTCPETGEIIIAVDRKAEEPKADPNYWTVFAKRLQENLETLKL